MDRTTLLELAAYFSAAAAAIALLIAGDDLSFLLALGGVCWIGGVLWQRLVTRLEDDEGDDEG